MEELSGTVSGLCFCFAVARGKDMKGLWSVAPWVTRWPVSYPLVLTRGNNKPRVLKPCSAFLSQGPGILELLSPLCPSAHLITG